MTSRTATKPTDNEPFDFNLDAVKAEVDLSPFRVHFGGQRWTFTHMEALDVWDLAESIERGDIQFIIKVLEEALGEQWEGFRKLGLPRYKMKALFEAYQQHCGLEPGESGASGS
ncbi:MULTISPECIES: hypothetical protein [Streptomyces]|jgi:hypothetical protein|uniref:Uncharacterized protein n=1 Tax=Streptomyces fradiae ATCC 10745 = DSM 40063 TaxID=1319510 RepID=A0A1Y2NST8_STRFR|nr:MULTISPECIES: hypothetical protein [Streptomyces]KAF0646706.1 hypothetical protein K701_27375 [Streptomyces fradiae ATCC 10745 = DSM 40063]OSY50592.1 hypothetical protein BG846_03760 [Streptomyces fradiae ATCC 10745 = DSM 40063]QEV11619.1 hypothetical protein CP974_05900 [Streptomyces fradiae ATCC 10745 = DSM 40063]